MPPGQILLTALVFTCCVVIVTDAKRISIEASEIETFDLAGIWNINNANKSVNTQGSRFFNNLNVSTDI